MLMECCTVPIIQDEHLADVRKISNAKQRFRKVQELCRNKRKCEVGAMKMEPGEDGEDQMTILRERGGCGRAQPKSIKVSCCLEVGQNNPNVQYREHHWQASLTALFDKHKRHR